MEMKREREIIQKMDPGRRAPAQVKRSEHVQSGNQRN